MFIDSRAGIYKKGDAFLHLLFIMVRSVTYDLRSMNLLVLLELFRCR